MAVSKKFTEIYSRSINVATCILISCVVLACYVLILILFLKPSALRITSFITPESQKFKPTTAVTLLAAILTGGTTSLIARAVEQCLWLKLTPRSVGRRLTVGESRRLAKWSVSSLAKILYVFDGSSWSLKLTGVMVIGLAIVGPVLVSGISQTEISTTAIQSIPPSSDVWSGWIDVANEQYNGGDFKDVPGETAALISLSNLTAPASSVCSDNDCSVTALTASIHATCQSNSEPHTALLNHNIPNLIYETYTSTYQPNASVLLSSGSPYTYANFTSYYAPGCDTYPGNCAPGSFAIIFGAFVNQTDTLNGPYYLNTVDCLLTFGTASVTQAGSAAPVINEGSFVQNTSSVNMPSTIVPLRRIYTEDPQFSSQWSFSAATGTGDESDTLYSSALATLLLTPKANSSGVEVAERIIRIFEMSTLMAFSREPYASDLAVSTTTSRPIYVYNRPVLTILLLPLVATLLGMFGRWKITGNDIFVGYDPVEIARRGPVKGLPDRDIDSRIDEMQVWSLQEFVIDDKGQTNISDKFAVG